MDFHLGPRTEALDRILPRHLDAHVSFTTSPT
jgi:hypothetical protein